MSYVSLQKEKKLMFKNMPLRFIFHISVVKKLFITLERFENSRLLSSSTSHLGGVHAPKLDSDE